MNKSFDAGFGTRRFERSIWEGFFRESVLANALGEYQDLYFRWLAARRDYPFLSDPPPAPPRFILMSEYLCLRDSLDREFARRT